MHQLPELPKLFATWCRVQTKTLVAVSLLVTYQNAARGFNDAKEPAEPVGAWFAPSLLIRKIPTLACAKLYTCYDWQVQQIKHIVDHGMLY